MSSQPDTQQPAQGDWLDGCIGFVAESGAGRIGRVAEVRRDDSGRPVALVLRAGVAGWRRLLVPIDEVAGVLPSSDRVILDGSQPPGADLQAVPSSAH